MVEYGCNVNNKFGFMSDDDDFDDPSQLVERAAKAEAVKAAAAKKAPVKPVAQPKEEVKTAAGKENRPVNGERGRGRGRGRGGPREFGNRPPRDSGDISGRFGESGRGRGRGRGGPRPFRGRGGNNASSDEAPKEIGTFDETAVEGEGFRGRRGRGGFGRGRGGRGRQFDRQSGSDRTGVRSVDKKEGHGKGNWGDVKDEIVAETEPLEGENQEPPVPREKTAEEIKYEEEMAEYNKMKTLKEFKAEQKAENVAFKTRKAGEGVQENFGKLNRLTKSDENKEEEVVVMRKESNKKVLNIDIHFTNQERGRGGDRGGVRGRGQRGRGGARGGSRANFDASAEDFPALK